MSQQQTSKPEKPCLDIEMWNYDDGSVGARLEKMPEGEMHANDAQTLQRGVAFIMQEMIEAEEHRVRTNGLQGKFDGGMQAMWIDGKFCVRFLPVVGFGVHFDVAEMLQPWLKVFLDVAIKGVKNDRAGL